LQVTVRKPVNMTCWGGGRWSFNGWCPVTCVGLVVSWARFANRTARLKDPLLGEQFIRLYEFGEHDEWFWLGEQIGNGSIVLLPFANQGAIRGDYRVFAAYDSTAR